MADQATPPQEEIHDAEVVDEGPAPDPGPGTAVATASAPPPTLTVAGSVEPADLVTRLERIRKAAEDAMEEGTDFGKIPGTDKPTLLKPGAEKLGVLFELDIQPRNEKRWEADGHLTVISHATVYHAPSGVRVGFGEGICTTREKKYAKRKQNRRCPNCDAEAVIKGKEEYGGGWLCWKKRDGCGSTWPDGAEVIESQEVGDIDNPNIADTWNTVTKMAMKRARVDAVLAVTGASALFTQDVEDNESPDTPPAGAAASTAELPAWAGETSKEEKPRAFKALAFLLQTGEGPNRDAAREVVAQIQRELGGRFPKAAFVALGYAAGKLRELDPKLAEAAAEAEEAARAKARQDAAEQGDAPAPESVDTPADWSAGAAGKDEDIPF